MFEHIGLRLDEASRCNAFFEFSLCRPINIERDMAEGAGGEFGAELGLICGVSKGKESECAAIGKSEKAVTIGTLRPEQFLLLTPCGNERKPENILIEVAGGLKIFHDISGVVKAAGQ